MTFIGPDADTIALMGDKISARDFAAAHGVPVAPSVMPTQDIDAFARDAASLTYLMRSPLDSLEHEHPNQEPDNDRRPNHHPIAHGEILPIVV